MSCCKSGQAMILSLSLGRFFKHIREAVGKLTKLYEKKLIEIPFNLPCVLSLKLSVTSITRLVIMSIMSKQLFTLMTCSDKSIGVVCQWIRERFILCDRLRDLVSFAQFKKH